MIISIPKKGLKHKYLIEGKSVSELAKEYNTKPYVISWFLKKYCLDVICKRGM